jgi:transposase
MRLSICFFFRCNCERNKMNVDVLGTSRRRRVYLSKIQIARAVTLIEEGHSRRQLARILNVIPAAINRAWIRYQIYGIVRRQPYLPRGRATSEREDRLIRLWATRVRASTTATLQNDLVEMTETRISTQTTLNRLYEREFNPRRPANVPPLSLEQRRTRRLFAQEHVDWNLEQWSNCLHHIDGRVRVWRRPGERYLDGTLKEKVPFGGESIMVWGGIILN